MQRWKKGIETISPLQQTRTQILFTIIILVGLACGFTVCLFALKTLWWLAIILGAGIGNTAVQLLAIIQKKLLLEKFEVNSEQEV